MNKAQQQQYYELLRELVMYANERLGGVRDFDVYRSSPATDSELEEDGNEIRPGEATPALAAWAGRMANAAAGVIGARGMRREAGGGARNEGDRSH